MNLIIKQAKSENGILHVRGFLDGREFYVNEPCSKNISTPKQLSQEEIQFITTHFYEFENMERVCEIQ